MLKINLTHKVESSPKITISKPVLDMFLVIRFPIGINIICGINAVALIIMTGQLRRSKTKSIIIWATAIAPKKLDIVKIKAALFIFIAVKKLRAIGEAIPDEPWKTPPKNPISIESFWAAVSFS